MIVKRTLFFMLAVNASFLCLPKYVNAQNTQLDRFKSNRYTLSESIYGDIVSDSSTNNQLSAEFFLKGNDEDLITVIENLLMYQKGINNDRIVFENFDKSWIDFESLVYDFGFEKAKVHSYYTFHYEQNGVHNQGVAYCLHFSNSRAKFRGFFIVSEYDDEFVIRSFNNGDQELYSAGTLICYNQYEDALESRFLVKPKGESMKRVDVIGLYKEAMNNFKISRVCH